MSEPLAYHLVFGAYGFWLPNDPRGSWSEEVWSDLIRAYGPAHKAMTCHSVAQRPHDQALRLQAKTALKHPPVKFTGEQARAIGNGFAHRVRASNIVVYACAIMPDHVHLVVKRHRHSPAVLVNQFKGAGSWRLREERLHPLAPMSEDGKMLPSPWSDDYWKAYLQDEMDLRSASAYVRGNPIKAGMPAQRWTFVSHVDA